MIDLHTHTTCSDGSLTPTELINEAKKIGLKAIAITDHDTLAGLSEGNSAAKKNSIIFVPGVEIEIYHPYSGEFHLLGLGLKELDGELNQKLEIVKNYRNVRNIEIIKLLNRDNIDISYSDVKSLAGGDIIARPHFSRCLVDKGYAKDQNDAFSNFLNPGSPYFVEKESLTLKEAIRLIHGAGGKAIIAHPKSLHIAWSKTESIFNEYKKIGLDGIEAWHGSNKKKECDKFEKIASKLRLIVSGGSDYHGKNINDRILGIGAGERSVPEILLSNFL
ncbi:MAG: PHP domain-containing protein [Spirochaetaceae bacterium]